MQCQSIHLQDHKTRFHSAISMATCCEADWAHVAGEFVVPFAEGILVLGRRLPRSLGHKKVYIF